jgi:hypothetical protein
VYQWNAVAGVLVGAIFTCMPSALPDLAPGLDGRAVAAALLFGLFAAFMTGVDFPESNRRFSRLT